MPVPEPLLTPRFAALWLYAFVTFFAAFQLLPVIPFRIIELGGSTAAAGWFLFVYTLASAFSAPLMGTTADRIGRRRMLFAASLAFCGFSIAYGLITHIGLLLLVGIVHGALWSGLLSSASAVMTDYIPESRRTQGLAYWGLASIAAISIAPAVGLPLRLVDSLRGDGRAVARDDGRRAVHSRSAWRTGALACPAGRGVGLGGDPDDADEVDGAAGLRRGPHPCRPRARSASARAHRIRLSRRSSSTTRARRGARGRWARSSGPTAPGSASAR